ncbi:MAG: hypothetical protein M3Q99_16520 [Acidobacteriota bacterium]|nr:hypothetical protein [Acidobacteriota bacterium]
MLLRNTKIKILFLVLFVLGFQLACTANKYRQPISKFQAASAVVSADARKSFTESNRLNRNLLIKKLTRDKQFVTTVELNKVQYFKPEELQARLDALDRLNEYVDLLVSIANSDAPENISKSATDLTGALGNLTNTVAGLQGGINSNFKEKTVNAFGLAGVIVSEVLKAFAQRKIKQGLEAAILNGERPISDLIDAISGDLDALNLDYVATFGRERDNFLKLYNCELNKVVQNPAFVGCPTDATPFSQSALTSYKEQFTSDIDTMDTLRAANPLEALGKMKKAHTKIVLLAKSKSPADFAEAVAAIEDFAASAKRLGDAVEELKNS